MPGARIEIPQILVQHLVHLGVERDHVIVGIAVIDANVVADAMTPRPPDNRHILLAQMIAGGLYVPPVLQLEGYVVHPRALAGCEVDGVMIRAAAHEAEEDFLPVRNPEAENLLIKLHEWMNG